MSLTEQDVLYVAGLARLDIAHDKAEKFRRELSAIINYMEILNKVPTEGVEPYVHVHSLSNVMREDLPAPSLSREEALLNAPEVHKGALEVPLVIDEG